MEEGLPIYVVFANPSDFPGKFVVRRHIAAKRGWIHIDAKPLMVEDEYDTIREQMLKMGLVKLDRTPGDDPIIMETWL